MNPLRGYRRRCAMIVSSSGNSLRCASMNCNSSGVMSSFRKIGWYQVRIADQVASRVTQQQRRERRVIVDDGAAFAVENLAARREHRNVANAILLGGRGVIATFHHLQLPQSVGEDQEDAKDDVLRRREADFGNFLVAAEHQFSLLSSRFSVLASQFRLVASCGSPRLENCGALL